MLYCFEVGSSKYYGSYCGVRATINYYKDIYLRGLVITFLTFILFYSQGDDVKCIPIRVRDSRAV